MGDPLKNLTAWQQFVSKRYPGAGASPNEQQYAQLATEFFGPIPPPPGVKPEDIITNTGAMLEYKDAQGFVHRLVREIDGRSPDAGKVRELETTNRPAVLGESAAGEQTKAAPSALDQLLDIFKGQATARQEPVNTGLEPFLAQLTQLTQGLSQPASLAQLDPQTKAALDAINAANQAKLSQQFNDQQGNLVADLFGRGTNRSSMAGQQAGRLLQDQGLVQSQELSAAAQRELQTRQFLSQLGQGNQALAQQGVLAGGGLALDQYGRVAGVQQGQQNALQGFFSDLMNQALSREVSSSQIGLQGQQLAQQGSQFNRQMQQQYLQFQEQQRAAERQALWNNIFKGVAAVTGGISGMGSMFSGLGGGASGNSLGGGYAAQGGYATGPFNASGT